jgi:hypothetical protein
MTLMLSPGHKFVRRPVNAEDRKVTYGVTSHGMPFISHVKLIGHLLSTIMTPVTELGNRRADTYKLVQRISLKP